MNAGEPGPIGPQVDRFPDPSGRPREPAELAEILGDWMSGPGPLYRKLAAALQRAVHDGSLEPGERLPSERALAKALVVSRATVVTAYDELRGLGIADSRRGSGTRVVRQPGSSRPGADGRVPGGRAASIIQRLIDGPAGVISLRHAMEGAVPELGTELAALLAEDLPALMRDTGYHPSGLPALRQAVAARLTAAGLPTASENVLVTTGVTQALALAAQMYLRRRSVVVVEAPGWPGCFDVFRAAGARLVGVPIDDDGIRVDELARTFAEHRPDLLYVMPTVHNPTGALMSEGRRRRVAEIAAEHRVPVLEDNAYDIGGASRPPPIAAYAPRGAEVLSADSLAKSVWGGLRTGWVRAPAGTIERLARHKALADLGSPVLDQALAARLLPRLPEIAAARGVVLRDRLDHLTALLAEHLPEWRFQPPAGGSALWIELPGRDARAFAQVALRYGVEVVPGATMDPTGAHDGYLRLPFTFPADVLTEVAARLTAAWADLTGRPA
ncbi:PLP-dependent aminotransferase family protein [Actinomadura sp. KC216]|uniref:aminotransferase-like domain-containing protein n=1 Tax=Actinomadura sp. KC216 TaxID=2530370 RepID=UPI00104B6E30|nr:PLP-dependent aminotransferase family protein [Actinomadura sp. KC216]TDB91583.1 PLP-dependent aminotransferase family protein [Actinomadura sp. KC216]